MKVRKSEAKTVQFQKVPKLESLSLEPLEINLQSPKSERQPRLADFPESNDVQQFPDDFYWTCMSTNFHTSSRQP